MRLIARSGLFDAQWYSQSYAVAPSLALAHYLVFGGALGCSPSRSFDAGWYLRQNPDIAASGRSPFVHYLKHGRSEGRRSLPYRRSLGAAVNLIETLGALAPELTLLPPLESMRIEDGIVRSEAAMAFRQLYIERLTPVTCLVIADGDESQLAGLANRLKVLSEDVLIILNPGPERVPKTGCQAWALPEMTTTQRTLFFDAVVRAFKPKSVLILDDSDVKITNSAMRQVSLYRNLHDIPEGGLG